MRLTIRQPPPRPWNIRRLCTHSFVNTLPPGVVLPPDVDPSNGLCADGFVRVGPAPGKGLGAFAAQWMGPCRTVGRYVGEVYRGTSELHKRYGVLGDIPEEHAEWQYAWSVARRASGVGVSGAYVVRVGACPQTAMQLYIDAEDPATASWTRFLNHAGKRPNLSMRKVGQPDGTPDVRFIVVRQVHPGDELLFDYGDAYWEAGDPIDEESWDDPRLY